jgi:hypothetical protein
MWIISEKESINLDSTWSIYFGANTLCYDDSRLVFKAGSDTTTLECNTFENAKEILKDINQALYDGKKTFNFDAHLSYIEKRSKNND